MVAGRDASCRNRRGKCSSPRDSCSSTGGEEAGYRGVNCLPLSRFILDEQTILTRLPRLFGTLGHRPSGERNPHLHQARSHLCGHKVSVCAPD